MFWQSKWNQNFLDIEISKQGDSLCCPYNLEEKYRVSAAVNHCKMMRKNDTVKDQWYLERKLSILSHSKFWFIHLKKCARVGESLKGNVWNKSKSRFNWRALDVSSLGKWKLRVLVIQICQVHSLNLQQSAEYHLHAVSNSVRSSGDTTNKTVTILKNMNFIYMIF